MRAVHVLPMERTNSIDLCESNAGFCNSKQFDERYREIFKKYPGYSHKNGNWRYVGEPVVSLFSSKENNIFARGMRLYDERVYAGYNDWQQTIITLCSLATIIITLVIIHYSYGQGIGSYVTNEYVFTDDKYKTDENVLKLKTLNSINRITSYIGMGTAALAAMFATWKLFKRTTKPNTVRQRPFRSLPFGRKDDYGRRNAFSKANGNKVHIGNAPTPPYSTDSSSDGQLSNRGVEFAYQN